MAEYIDREKVLQAFSDFVRSSNNSDFVPAPVWNNAVDIVIDMPTADVKPVVRGEWIEHNYDYDTIYTCSACNEDFVTFEGTPADNLWNFCPHCGADMRGDDND